MPFDLSPGEEASFWTELRRQDQQYTAARLQAYRQPAVAANLAAIHTAAPAAPPGVKLSLAQASFAGMISLDGAKAAAMSSYLLDPANRAQVMKPGVKPPSEQKSLVGRIWSDVTFPFRRSRYDTKMSPELAQQIEDRTGVRPEQGVRSAAEVAAGPPHFDTPGSLPNKLASIPQKIIRPALAVAETPAQFQSNLFLTALQHSRATTKMTQAQADQIERRTGVRPDEKGILQPGETVPPVASVADIARATTGGQAIADIAEGRPVSMGSGFVPAGTNEIQRKYMERKVSGIIPGSGRMDQNGNPIPGTEQTATLGRFFMDRVFEPGSTGYRWGSGGIDAWMAWHKDPFNIVAQGAHDVRAVRSTIAAAPELSVEDIAKATRGEEIVSHPVPLSPGDGIVEHPQLGEGIWRTPDTPSAQAAKAATATDGPAWQAYNDRYDPGLNLYNVTTRSEHDRVMAGDPTIFDRTRDAMYLNDVIAGTKRVMSVDDPTWEEIVKARAREAGLHVRVDDNAVYVARNAADAAEYSLLKPIGALAPQREYELIGHNPEDFVPKAKPPTFVPIAQIRTEARQIRNEAGLIDSSTRWTVAPKGAENLLASPMGQELKRLAANDRDIISLSERFGNRVDPDTLVKILDAHGDEAAVGEILLDEVLGHSVRSTTDLQKIRTKPWWTQTREWVVPEGVQSAAQRISESRMAQPMPHGFQLTGLDGSTSERIEAMQNIKHIISNSHIPYEQKSALVEEFARAANRAEKYNIRDDVQTAIQHTIEQYLGKYKHPIFGKVNDQAATDVARGLTRYSDEEAIRMWARDRTGLHTDGGFLSRLQDERGYVRDPDTGLMKAPSWDYDPETGEWHDLQGNLVPVDSAGNPVLDAGYGRGEVNDTLTAIGPQMLSEGLGDVMYFPNLREIRRMSSKYWWMFTPWNKGSPTGKLRPTLSALEFVQNEIIKPLAIIRPAFLLRVIGEEQFRMAASGQSSLVAHPLDHIQLAMHNSGAWDATGRSFDAIAERMSKQDWYDEYAASLHSGSHGRGNKYLMDPLAAERDSFRTGSWSIADKLQQPELWKRGLGVDEMRQMRADTLTAKVAGGDTNEEIIDWLHTPDGLSTQRELRAFLADKAARGQDGKWVAVHLDSDDPVVVDSYLDSLRERVDTKVGQNAELRQVIAKGTIGTEEVDMIDSHLVPFEAGARHIDPLTNKASTWIGSKVRLPDDRVGIIVGTGTDRGHSIVMVPGQAWDDQGRMSKALKEEIDNWHLDPSSPDAVKVAVYAKDPKTPGMTEAARHTHEMRNLVVNAFFAGIYGKSSDYLSRSPSFRQFYWQRTTELADRLAPEEANKFLHNMEDAAARHEGNSVSKLLGSDKRVDRAIEQAGKASGTLTVEQLDDYARGWALDETKKLLYDATRRSQWSDIARVVMPFAEPWKEVLSSWGRIITRDPRLIRRGQLIVEGGEKLDPDGDGQGWFHVDPASGKYVFAIPGATEAVRYMTSIPGASLATSALGAKPIEMTFNVAADQLNVGFSVAPQLGWIATAAVDKLIPNQPRFDAVRAFLLPRGTQGNTLKNLVEPSWLQKIVDGVTGGPRSTGMFGDTYTRITQVKMASGEYGNTTEEQQRLLDDALKEAKAVMIVRGIVQSSGPAAPSIDFSVKVHPQAKPGDLNTPPEMDMMASQLAREYYRMSQEDPQNVVENFTMLYGPLAASFMVGRTKAVNGGIDNSKEFGNWERSHSKLFKANYAPDVAGYFAPIGDTPDQTVTARHVASGQSVKLTAAEYADAVNERLGNQMYYTLKDAIIAQNLGVGRKSLTTEQADYLRNAREKIYERFPVANPNRYDRAGFPAQLRQLVKVVDDKSLADNPVATAARDYLTLRQQALDAVAQSGGGTLGQAKFADLRAWLDSAGTALIKRTPEFQRLWDRVLSQEVETQVPGG